MTARIAQFAAMVAGVTLFVGAMVYPAAALAVRGVSTVGASSPVPGGSWTLFGYSVALAAGGALSAVVLAVPGAYAVGRLGRRPRDGLTLAVLMAPVLLPAMVYAFGWERLLNCPGELRCIWVWASWTAPIPALLIGGGWARLGRRAYEEALTATSASRAFVYAVAPILRRHVLAAGLVLFAFFLGDYSVPHACALVVHATDLLSRAEATGAPRAVVLGAAPGALVIVVVLAAAAIVWRRVPVDEDAGEATLPAAGWSVRLTPVAVAGVCVVVPVAGLARTVDLGASIWTTLETYATEVVASLGIALLAGVAAVLMGAALVVVDRVRRWALLWALLWAALPGALVGQAVVTAYLPLPIVYDHWMLMLFGYVARFGWVGILAAWLARTSASREQEWAARSDGATRVGAAWRIALASNAVTLVCGVLVIAALSLSEVATTSLVRVPAIDPVSLILIEKFHRFEDGILVALSLLLVAAAIPGAVLAGVAARRWR